MVEMQLREISAFEEQEREWQAIQQWRLLRKESFHLLDDSFVWFDVLRLSFQTDEIERAIGMRDTYLGRFESRLKSIVFEAGLIDFHLGMEIRDELEERLCDFEESIDELLRLKRG